MSTRNRFIINAVNKTLKCFEKEKEAAWKGPFCFIQAADTQFGMIAAYLEKKETPEWHKEVALTRTAIMAANRMEPKPRFFIVCGDLVDAFPETYGELRTRQENDFKEVFSELDPNIPLVCVCGNHDVGNTPTHETVSRYHTTFGDDYFSFWCGGVFFIVVNSQYYYEPSQVQDLAAEQDSWLEGQLQYVKTAQPKHVCVFQHIPPFLKSPDEETDEYFNLPNKVREKYLSRLKQAGVSKVFCGHYHRNAGGWDEGLEVVVTSAVGAQLGNDGHGFRVVSVLEDSVQHSYYKLDEVPAKIIL